MPSLKECVERVTLMASGDPTWDLSDNDTYALSRILAENALLAKSCQQWLAYRDSLDDAISDLRRALDGPHR